MPWCLWQWDACGCLYFHYVVSGQTALEELTGGCHTNRAAFCIGVLCNLMPSQEMDQCHCRRGKESKEISHRRWRVKREEARREKKKLSSSPSEWIFFSFLPSFHIRFMDLYIFGVWWKGPFLIYFLHSFFFFSIFATMCLFCCSKTCQILMSVNCCLKSLHLPLFPILYNLSLITMAVS